MNRFVKLVTALLIGTLFLTGCNSLTPEEWLEKEKEMGTAYGEQLLAGKYPTSWSQFGELIDYEYCDGPTTDIDAFEGTFAITDNAKILVEEIYMGKASGDKVFGRVKVIIYSDPIGDSEATTTVKALLDRVYGNLDWTFSEPTDIKYASFEARDVEFKSAFTADVSNLPYLDYTKDEGVRFNEDGFQTYFRAIRKVIDQR